MNEETINKFLFRKRHSEHGTAPDIPSGTNVKTNSGITGMIAVGCRLKTNIDCYLIIDDSARAHIVNSPEIAEVL